MLRFGSWTHYANELDARFAFDEGWDMSVLIGEYQVSYTPWQYQMLLLSIRYMYMFRFVNDDNNTLDQSGDEIIISNLLVALLFTV